MFVQKLNPLTGEADWVLVNDPGLGDNDDASADLVATSSYLDMLTDRRRNAAYYAAIRRVIPARKQESSAAAAAAGATTCGQASSSADGAGAGTDLSAVPAPNDREDVRVLDIGTGTGLLAMMAARVLATGDGVVTASGGDAATGAVAAAVDATPSAPVIACEVFPPMHNLSRRVIAGNGLASMIRVLNKRSDEIVAQHPGGTAAAAPAAAKQPKAALQAAVVAHAAAAAAGGGAAAGPDMYGRADIIVTEIFDSELLGEGMIPTMRHAVQHLLKDDGVVIPATSRVYGQLVKCPLMHLMTGLRFGDPCPWPSDGVSAYTAIGDGAGGGCASVPSKSTAAAVTDAAADRVLEALGELDARARVATFCSEDLYEVREMHVDLLYQHAVCRDPSPAPQVSPQYLEVGLKTQQQQPLQTLSDPFLVFEFDWLRPPPPSGRQTVCKVPVLQDGSAHAVLLWWQLGMMPPQYDTRMAAAEPQHQAGRMQNEDPESDRPPVPGGRAPGFSGAACHSPVDRSPQAEPCLQPDAAPLLLSTAPAWLGDCVEAGGDGGPLEGVKQQWRDHWKQCWVQLAYDAVPVRRGNVLRIAFEHDDFNIRSKMVAEAQPGKPAAAAVAAAATVSTSTVANLGTSVAGAPKPLLQSAKERLVALQAEVEEEALTRQQLMPLLSWLGPLVCEDGMCAGYGAMGDYGGNGGLWGG
ncbi:hypothetical protein Vretimale_15814 [Volvox reticuliferus]|uniref:type I protein arginine methyltransferase n=1 Tax=Volvox reticuliferus TaxID=1737510 RepID=A0A8J4LWJ9_9CHLO|nr:hypothetical protein Vretimale_15814 [Volvox reticuliferus]